MRREQLDAGSGQFDSQGQAIETGADFGDGTSVGRGHLERGLDCPGALEEEGNGGIVRQGIYGRKLFQIGERQWRNGKLVFALDVQHGTAGDQHFQLRARGQQVGQVRGCWQNLLEIVEDEQQVLVFQEGFQQVQQGARSALFEVERLGDARDCR